MAIYIYEQFKVIDFFDLVSDKEEFIVWVSNQLTESQILEGSLIQVEGKRLTHLNFIMHGTAAYVLKGDQVVPYYTLNKGTFFGGEDVYLRMNESMRMVMKRRKLREMSKTMRVQKMKEMDHSFDFDSDEYMISSEEDSDDDEMEACDKVFNNPDLKAKTSVKAMTTCHLL